jgi:hypothetical protein
MIFIKRLQSWHSDRDAVVVPNTSLLNPIGAQIAELAAEHRLPTIGSALFARAGGLRLWPRWRRYVPPCGGIRRHDP